MLRMIRSFNRLGQVTASMIARMDQVVRDTAADIVIDAQDNAPVDTGALRASIHAVTDRTDDYAVAAAEAAALRNHTTRPGAPAIVLPEVHPTRPHEAIVASCVEHGAVNEFGGATAGARPFFVPAVEHASSQFFDQIQDVLDNP